MFEEEIKTYTLDEILKHAKPLDEIDVNSAIPNGSIFHHISPWGKMAVDCPTIKHVLMPEKRDQGKAKDIDPLTRKLSEGITSEVLNNKEPSMYQKLQEATLTYDINKFSLATMLVNNLASTPSKVYSVLETIESQIFLPEKNRTGSMFVGLDGQILEENVYEYSKDKDRDFRMMVRDSLTAGTRRLFAVMSPHEMSKVVTDVSHPLNSSHINIIPVEGAQDNIYLGDLSNETMELLPYIKYSTLMFPRVSATNTIATVWAGSLAVYKPRRWAVMRGIQ